MSISLRAVLHRALRPQFGLKGLLLAMTIAGVWVSIVVRHAREQQTAVRLIRDQGGIVYYDFQEPMPGSGRYDDKAKSDLPAWLVARLGEDFFSNVVFAQLGGQRRRDEKDKISDMSPQSAVQHLPGLRKLRHLMFMDVDVTDEALRSVGELKDLETLMSLSDASKVTDAGVAYLAGLQKLKTLALLKPAITDESLKTLGRLHSLEGLQLGRTRITDQGLVHLRGLKQLQFLGLGECGGITDKGMSSLGGLICLNGLDLSDARVTAAGLEHLKGLQQLRLLWLSNNPELADDAMRIVAQFSRLEELKLGNTKVTSIGMQYLAGLTKLRVLDLSSNPGVTDEGAAYLSSLMSLEDLKLRNTRVSSSAVERLGGLIRLQQLDLSDNPDIDEKAAPYLAKLVALRELDLHHTKVRLTQESADRLKPLTALRYLDLSETGSDCRAAEAALPTCQVAGSQLGNLSLPDTRDYWLLNAEIGRQQICRMKAEIARKDPGFKVRDFIPSPELLPPKNLLERMIALAENAGLDPALGAQRPALEAFANRLARQGDRAVPAKAEATELRDFARSNALLEKLYTAAIDLDFADRLSKYTEYLEGVRSASGLTEVEQRDYRDAVENMNTCLAEASWQLGLGAQPASDRVISIAVNDAIIRVWKDTQDVARRHLNAGAERR